MSGATTTVAVPPVGTRIEQGLMLDEAAIRAGATLIGDLNPLHHDAAYAASTRFGGLIASGAHTAALLAGMIGARLVQDSAKVGTVVGMDYRVQFRAPVPVDRAMRMEWVVTAVEPRRSGHRVRLTGRIADADSGAVAIEAEMTCLFLGAAA